eukprot:14266125-Alexandrium_andersonii.AAC.1
MPMINMPSAYLPVFKVDFTMLSKVLLSAMHAVAAVTILLGLLLRSEPSHSPIWSRKLTKSLTASG